MTPTRAIPLLLALAFTLAPLNASADVYKCVDANGKTSYTNDRPNTKGCTTLSNEQAVSTISMRGPASTPASFPKVSNDAQRDRDGARRDVLESELASERAALDDARKALATQEAIRNGDERNYQKVLDRLQPFKDDVDRRTRNVEALNKEISGLR
jgi:septal ring factor EnvC (AmiA/AmiB activator)